MPDNIRTTIVSHFEQIASEQHHRLLDLSDDRPLMECGLDSLGFAVLVARLEDALGCDPFSVTESASYPETFGDFVQLYEKMGVNAAT